MTASLQMLAQAFTGGLLNAAVEGLGLAALVWIFLRVARRQDSGTRFIVWFFALLAIAALPFLSAVLFAALPGDRSFALSNPQFVLSSSLASYLFAAWAVGAGLLLLRLAIGLFRLLLIRRECTPIDLATVDPEIAAVCRDFQSVRQTTLCTSADVSVPSAVGLFRPAVVFPAHLFASLSTEEIKAILLHELAHLRRWDDWTNLAQKILKAVFFFHPAVWWIDNHLTLEREIACDDVVLSQTASPRVYASSLISFAEKLKSSHRPALVQALVHRVHHMTLRVTQILDTRRPRGNAFWKPALAMSAALFVGVLGATPFLPTIVAVKPDSGSTQPQPIQAATFQNSPASVSSSVIQTASAIPAIKNTAPQAGSRRPRAIAAAYHPRAKAVPRKLSSEPKPRLLRAALSQDYLSQDNLSQGNPAQDNLQPQPTFLILQTARYNAYGRAVWTLSVWKIGGDDGTERELQSAWIVSSI